jgi:ABC-type transporter Mla subunit MlaD
MSGSTIKAGFFVLSGIVLAAFVTVVLAKTDFFQKRLPYTVRFTVSEGVSGLAPGSAVKIGGLQRGAVVDVTPNTGSDGAFRDIYVNIEVDDGVRLFPGAKVVRIMPLLGENSTLNFVSIGSGDEPLPAGTVIEAANSAGVIAALLGADNAAKAGTIIDDAVVFSNWLASLPRDYQERIVPMLDNAGETVKELRADYGTWRTKVDGTLTSAQAAAGDAASSMKGLDELLVRNSPKIDSALTDIAAGATDARASLAELRAKTVPLLNDALSNANAAIGSFEKSVQLAHAFLLENLPGISLSLDNVRTATAQLKLAAMEVRRSPWKIMYQPGTEEVAHENLYEAARSFAMAASDLRAAGDSLRLVLTNDPALFERDPAFRDAVQKMVLDAMQRYESAQQQLNSVLMGPAPAGEAKGN